MLDLLEDTGENIESLENKSERRIRHNTMLMISNMNGWIVKIGK